MVHKIITMLYNLSTQDESKLYNSNILRCFIFVRQFTSVMLYHESNINVFKFFN